MSPETGGIMITNKYNAAGTPRIPTNRGSALIIVVMLCAFTLILVGSYLAAISAQSKLNYRATLQNEARNAAAGVAEYAAAEMDRRAAANASFGATANPLQDYSLPAADLNFIAPGTGNNHVVASQVEFKNSVLSDPPSGPMLIEPNDPVNNQDPDVGKILSVLSLNIFGKAAVFNPQTGKNITSYVSQNVQIRSQAWFNYAIFYNMDMEFHAGPKFTILGPVATNANVYATEGTGNNLEFLASLAAYGSIFRYDKYTGNTSGGHTGTVLCQSAAGMLAANLKSMATTEDSTNTHFYTAAKTKWNSFVQDHTFSVKKFNPPGLPAYVPEDFTTAATELRNNAYSMIEPQLSSSVTDLDLGSATTTDYGQKPLATENLKFSALSGFVIQVYPPTSIGAQPKWKLVLYQATDTTHPLSPNNPPARDATTGKPIIALTIDPFNDIDDVQHPAPTYNDAKIKRGLKTALLDAIISVPYGDAGSSGTSWGNGFSALKAFTQTATGATNTITYYPIYDRREGYIYPNSATSNTNGLTGAFNVLEIDLGKLNTLLNDTTGLWLMPYGSTTYVYNPATSYTGVVYVQFPLAPINSSRFPAPLGSTADGDQIRPAQAPDNTAGKPGYALLLAHGTKVPQMAGGLPDGFTIATNGPAYIWGHFNADGNSATGSDTLPDGPNEVPALIAADALTVLSPNNATTLFPPMAKTMGSAAAFTEISAAIMAGLVPTHPGYSNVWSGGVHNLVRFLENWGGATYRYRGSIAVLYESEVATHAYHEGYNGYFYQPPTRDLGYHQFLAQGRFPPATPIKRTVRRMNLQDITAATYDAGPQKPPVSN